MSNSLVSILPASTCILRRSVSEMRNPLSWDEKWVSRGLFAWRAGPRLGLTSWLSWEEGRSSRPNRGYETWIAWAGLNLYF